MRVLKISLKRANKPVASSDVKEQRNLNYTEETKHETHNNFNASNTCITVAAGEGGVEAIHVDSPDPNVAEALFNRVYDKLKADRSAGVNKTLAQ